MTVNKRDLIHHESEQREYRKLKCRLCGEISITVGNIEKRIVTVDRNIEDSRYGRK